MSFFSVPTRKFEDPAEKEQQIFLYQASNELKKATPYLTGKWKMQDNKNDKLTNEIVYNVDTFDELQSQYKEHSTGDFNYLVHRWYNRMASEVTEKIFCSYPNSEKEANKSHKTIDFYLLSVPFDLKVTSFPKKFNKQRKDYTSDRAYRNDLIRWLYEYQSQEGRNHEENRLFVVCKHNSGKNSKNNLLLKMDFSQIEKKVEQFLIYSEKRFLAKGEAFNKVLLSNGKSVYADVIFITNTN